MTERIDQPGAAAIGEQLLTMADGDVLVLILDMTGTAAFDHAGGSMLARVGAALATTAPGESTAPPGRTGATGPRPGKRTAELSGPHRPGGGA